jgi:hypothetical protein
MKAATYRSPYVELRLNIKTPIIKPFQANVRPVRYYP